MNRVYLDTEYCYPGMIRGQPRPTAANKRQIVQIAAIIVDINSGKEVARFDKLVIPSYEKLLPDFFVELTGITQDDIVLSGISFDKAFNQFVEFVGNVPIWTFDKDEEVLRQNCVYTNMAWPLNTPFTRVKSLLPTWGINPDEFSSGTLHEAVGLDMQGHVHNALHDVRSMAKTVHILELS